MLSDDLEGATSLSAIKQNQTKKLKKLIISKKLKKNPFNSMLKMGTPILTKTEELFVFDTRWSDGCAHYI